MKAQRSPGTSRRYPLTMICRVYRLARSSVYAAVPAPTLDPPGKRGPKTRVSDAALVAEIRAVLAACPFHGEGYRKVRARLAHRGRAVSGKRVLRLMRQHGLLAPRRLGPPNGNPAHDGTITTDRPDEMGGTDATRFYTERDGWGWFFGAIDHTWTKSSAGTRRSSAIAGPPSSRFAKASAMRSAVSGRTSRGG